MFKINNKDTNIKSLKSFWHLYYQLSISLCEMCPNTEIFLVRIWALCFTHFLVLPLLTFSKINILKNNNKDTRVSNDSRVRTGGPHKRGWQEGSFAPHPSIFYKHVIVNFVSQPFHKAQFSNKNPVSEVFLCDIIWSF